MAGLQKAETSDSDHKGTNVYNEITHYVDARTIPYHLFPEHFTWNQTSHTWAPRKKGNVIRRLYRANPAEGERFFLRLLLHHCPDATCYEDLRKLEDGTVCSTFKETAMKRGFLHHDEEWVECLTEAAAIATPTQIRLLFVTILLFCEPSEPAKLWE
ncbi:unnamed protein product [Mytilus coruscus]|uniref:Uncharacterized protein n=1 Tax=Mytilus coruscus TaxID=42192 RepID=A0A6J8CYV1_MYTCO|nr:unnamed protein product [Mytilus coruscus]